ncbi:MAG: hypothetical protein ACREQR_19085 [Candidatus Binataceae bacterium]
MSRVKRLEVNAPKSAYYSGYRALSKLDAALRAHDAALDRGVDNRKQAA